LSKALENVIPTLGALDRIERFEQAETQLLKGLEAFFDHFEFESQSQLQIDEQS